ncbi:ribonuclease HI [Geobacillus phage GR1]|nr:ribonuclease HI [Geobacillus phage GR1]
MNRVIIYTDGGVRGNGKENNVGGYGVVLQYGEHTKELYQGFRNVTNNQMELRAAIEGLKAMKKFNIPVEVRTDSAYLCNCINQKWYVKWMNNGWVTSSKTPVENRELWIELIDLIDKFAFIQFTKVKGHSGEPGNERADELANKAMDEML